MQTLIDQRTKTMLTEHDDIMDFVRAEGFACTYFSQDKLSVEGETLYIGVDCIVYDDRGYEIMPIDDVQHFFDEAA